MNTRHKKFILLIGIVLGLIVGFHNLSNAFEASITNYPSSPNAELVSFSASSNVRGQECLPESATSIRLVGNYEDSVALYQLWEYTEEEGHRLRVTLLFGEACGIAYDPFVGDEITDRIPLEGARSLSVQLIDSKIEEAGRVADFEASLIEELSQVEGGKPELTSVYVWALQELGVQIPDDLYIFRDIDDKAPR